MRAQRILSHLQGQYFVYCAQAWQRAATLTALRIPITSPPVTIGTFYPAWMQGKRLLYFKLHGYEDWPQWDGMDGDGQRVPALTPDLVRRGNLTGAIVVAVVCHGMNSEMQQAFFDAGAVAFFGSPAEVRSREIELGEADLLAQYLLRILAKGQQDLQSALARAREMYQSKRGSRWTEHDRFTLETFCLNTKGHNFYA